MEKSITNNLLKLRELMPGEDDRLYRFGECLADKIEIYQNTPEAFCMGAVSLVADMLMVDHYYASLEARISDIAQEVCPKDFAQEVKEYWGKS